MTTLTALERSADVQEARAGDHPDHADAVERARAQRRDRRRRAGAWRSAHGPAAGADGARRDAHRGRRRRASASVALEDFFTGYYETVLEKDELIAEAHVPAQGAKRARLHEGHHRLGRRLAGARRRGRARSRRQGDQVGPRRGQRRDRQGDPAEVARKPCSTGKTVDDKLLAQAGDAAVEEAEFIADVRGSAAYKRELLRVYVGAPFSRPSLEASQ